MKCYNCGADLSENEFCPNCGADVKLYKRIQSFSNYFYNEGLEKASVRDLSGAVDCLRASLKLNKCNIDARNLLGLIYYERGETVRALSEWVISKNLRSGHNIADGFMNELKNNPTRLEAVNQTIRKYNIAIKYCHKGNLDMAVLQLKKILSTNPNFVCAHQLLALLYLNNGNYVRAEKEMQRCLKIDNGDTLTHQYLREAQQMQIPGEDDVKHISDIPSEMNVLKYKSGNETIIQPVHDMQPKGSVSFISIVIGIALGIAFACFLILPGKIQSSNSENIQKITSISEESDAKTAQITTYESQIEALQEEKDKLQKQIDDYEGTDSTVEAMDYLMSAATTYITNPGDTESIAADMEHVDPDSLGSSATTQFKALYNTMIEKEGARLGSYYYKLGYAAYREEDYETAIPNLTMAYQYTETNGDALFYLASSYYAQGDTDKAKKAYDEVIKNFPNTRKASNAEAKIAEINNADVQEQNRNDHE